MECKLLKTDGYEVVVKVDNEIFGAEFKNVFDFVQAREIIERIFEKIAQYDLVFRDVEVGYGEF